MSGRKRHIVADTTGLLLAVVIHAANIQDRNGARLVLAKLLGRFPRLQVIWAGAAYASKLTSWAWATGGWSLQVVRRSPDSHQFEVLPRRWMVNAHWSGSAVADGSARTTGNCRKQEKLGFI